MNKIYLAIAYLLLLSIITLSDSLQGQHLIHAGLLFCVILIHFIVKEYWKNEGFKLGVETGKAALTAIFAKYPEIITPKTDKNDVIIK